MPSKPFDAVKFAPQKRPRRGAFLTCASCRREFYVYPSRLRQVEKTGHTVRYCSNACYNKSGENNPFFGGKHSAATKAEWKTNPNRPRFAANATNPNVVRFGADFTPAAPTPRLRARLMQRFEARCFRCGFAALPGILEIHHRDRNRRNNTSGNLELLCPNCHAADHYAASDGQYNWLKPQLHR